VDLSAAHCGGERATPSASLAETGYQVQGFARIVRSINGRKFSSTAHLKNGPTK
jgi:hypothetical protein